MTQTPSQSLGDQSRVAAISSTEDGAIGACIYLSVSDLCELGVDPEDVDELVYEIDSATNQIEIREQEGGRQDE